MPYHLFTQRLKVLLLFKCNQFIVWDKPLENLISSVCTSGRLFFVSSHAVSSSSLSSTMFISSIVYRIFGAITHCSFCVLRICTRTSLLFSFLCHIFSLFCILGNIYLSKFRLWFLYLHFHFIFPCTEFPHSLPCSVFIAIFLKFPDTLEN